MGKPLGGAAPFGYQWKDGKLLPDEKEAPVRKLLYELFCEHRRKKTVARLLNDKGYRTRNGSAFSDTTVARLIRDPTAKGLRRANYTSTTNNKKAWKIKPESEWVIHEVEPVVSEELWAECNAILDDNRAKGKKPAKRVIQLFAGVTYCSCGGKMYVPSNSPKYICKACRNKIPIVDLEAVFHEQLKNFLFSPDELAEHLHQADAAIKEKADLLGVLIREKAKLTAEMEKLYDLYQSNAIDKAGFGAKYHPLSERGRQLDEEIPRNQAELDVLKIAQLSQEEIVSEARDLFTRWPTLGHDERRRIVEAITERITIGADDIAIDLFYAPPVSSQATHAPARATLPN
jgi:site-specific DNA recombinase